MPDHSWPRMAPGFTYRSNTRWRSDPQIPHSATSTSSSPGRGRDGDLLDVHPAIPHTDGRGHQTVGTAVMLRQR